MKDYIYHLALDIGASSGKALIGFKDDKGKIRYRVIYRFKNGFKVIENHKIWDIEELYTNLLKTLKISFKKYKKIESLSIDTWGCDYVLLDKNDKEILPCYCYRDDRSLSILDEVFSKISKKEIFNETGCQFQSFNSIFQLYKDKKDSRLNNAKEFLLIPEYLIFKLSGCKIHELSNASTTSLLEKDKYQYSKKLINILNLPDNLFKNISKPGLFVGKLIPEIEKEVGGNLNIKLCLTHDTGSAVRYIEQYLDEKTLYLSSGTWSLLGCKVNKYIINNQVFESNFSNELGKNYIRFQKNIMGLWIIQSLLRSLNIDIVSAIKLAKESKYQNIIVDINYYKFLSTNNMEDELRRYLKNKGFEIDFSISDLINIVFVSLAYSYKKTIEEIEKILKRKFEKLLILGGGAKNKYLNDLISKICKIKIKSLPYECSALGNLLSQIED